MIIKIRWAALYDTTDLATIIQRMKLYKPDEICYLADKTSGASLSYSVSAVQEKQNW